MSDTCYSVNESGTWNASVADWAPCGTINATNPRVACCQRDDACMTNNLCYRSNSRVGASGFYSAGCTNLDFGPGCSNRCADTNIPEAVYNGSDTWKCCGKDLATGNPTCQTPTDETFFAPEPKSLIQYNYAGQMLSPLSTAKTSASSTAAEPTQLAPQYAQPSPLSDDIIAVIVVGCFVAVAFMGALVWFCLMKRRRRRQRGKVQTGDDASKLLDVSKESTVFVYAKHELDSQRSPYAELDHGVARSPVELSGSFPVATPR